MIALHRRTSFAPLSRSFVLLMAAALLMNTAGCPTPPPADNDNGVGNGSGTDNGRGDPPNENDDLSDNPQPGQPDDPGQPNDPGQPTPDPDTPFDVNAAPVPFLLIEEGVTNGSQVMSVAVDAALLATLQAAQSLTPKPLNAQANLGPVLTGTLTEAGGQVTYTPEPADRLIVNTSVVTGEFVFGTLQGNLTGDSGQFFEGDHELDVTVAITQPRAFDGRLTSNRQRRSPVSFTSDRTTTLDASWASANGQGVQANLTGLSEIFFENDTTGSEFRDASVYTGTLNAGAQATTVNDTRFFQIVTAGGESSSLTQQTSNSTWTDGANNYRYDNVRLSTRFRDGRVNDTENWVAEGQLFRNEAAVATFELANEGEFMKLYLNAGDGNRRELSSWRK